MQSMNELIKIKSINILISISIVFKIQGNVNFRSVGSGRFVENQKEDRLTMSTNLLQIF